MVCELRQILNPRGFATNRRRVPGQMAFEKYWQAVSQFMTHFAY